MSTRSEMSLAELTAQQIVTGIYKQDSPEEIPLWVDGYNIRFTETGIAKMQGWASVFTELGSTPIRGMHQFRDSTGIQWIWFGDQTELYSWNTVTVVQEGTGFTGNLNGTVTSWASMWSIQNFGNFVVATNGKDAPQKDVGAGLVPLGADFSTAEIFLRSKAHMLAFNTSINPRGFVWSDEDDVETWTPASNNAAGDLIIRELTSEIYAAVPLGDRIAVYGKDQMFHVVYQGAPFYFGYAPALEGIGAVSKASVIPVGRKNYGLGRQGVWVTDGVSHEFIDGPLHDYLQDDINWTQSTKVNGWHDEENHQVIWYYPSTGGSGEPDKGIAYDYKKGVWSLFDFGRTASMPRDVYAYPWAATNGGQVFYQNFGDDADGAALSARVETKLSDLGDLNLMKTLLNARIEWSGTGLLYAFGTSTDTDTTATFDSTAAVPSGYNKIDLRKTGRYHALRLESTAVGDTWELHGVKLYGVARGRR